MSYVHRFIKGALPETLVLLHGTGGDENDLVPLGENLLPGAAILSLRGNVMEHGMPRFFQRFAEGVFDEEDIRRRAAELAAFMRNTAEKYEFDPDRVIALGYSNGANMAAATLLLHGPVFSRALLFRAMVPLEPEAQADLHGVRVFLANGRQDPIVPVANAERLGALLQGCGAETTLAWSVAGHNLTQGDLEGARKWLSDISGFGL